MFPLPKKNLIFAIWTTENTAIKPLGNTTLRKQVAQLGLVTAGDYQPTGIASLLPKRFKTRGNIAVKQTFTHITRISFQQ